MQVNLMSLFAGKCAAVELPPKRGPGRLKKVRTREEEEDAVVAALQSRPYQPGRTVLVLLRAIRPDS